MTLHWTLGDVAAATGGSVVGDAAVVITSVGIDSRQIDQGELFVAVAGERFDGHDFLRDALEHGAAAVLVSRGTALEPRAEVEDTQAALRAMAVARRNELSAKVVAVTGSTGKTSTKDLLAAALPESWASPRSFNNEFGVPLTVLSTPEGTKHLVLEVGSRGGGHIAWLMPAVRPDVAVITNLGVVHLETFGSLENLAAAKWELVEALDSAGVAVVPSFDPRLHRSHAGRTITFGEDPSADVHVANVVLEKSGRPSFDVICDQGSRRVSLQMAGRHQALNAAAAVAAGRAIDVPLDTLVRGLEQATASPWRMEVHSGPITVVNDAYNANPDSVAAALRTVAEMPGRHIAVLGRMAELGAVAEEEHLRIGGLVASLGFESVIVVGKEPGIARGAGPIAIKVADQDEAELVLQELLQVGDVVLVKASRTVGLERLADRLVGAGAA